jgi:hypothetical protein
MHRTPNRKQNRCIMNNRPPASISRKHHPENARDAGRASQAPRHVALRRANRCLASTGRLSALRPPLMGWRKIANPGRKMRRGNELCCVLGCLTS